MHKPVLKKEVIEYLDPEPNQNFIDCTVGEGGHTRKILEKTAPQGKVLGLDWDKEMIERAKKTLKPEFGQRIILLSQNFRHLRKMAAKTNIGPVSGVLFDLGMSMVHIKESGRGFSFQKEEPLSMRYHPDKEGLTAWDVVNKWSRKEIQTILKEYGEEPLAEKIAEAIVKRRKRKTIQRADQLAEIIKRVKKRRGKIHPATKSFQALRIAVNREFENLKKALPQAVKVTKKGGRIVVISFHSLEDGMVKRFFRKKKKQKQIKVLTRRPVRAKQKEINKNPSARSARLRAAQKIKQ